MQISRRSAFLLPLLATLFPRAAAASTSRAPLASLQSALQNGRFITYQPTALQAINGVLSPASDQSIVSDLKILRPYFDCLITYGAQAGGERIADLAATLNFRAVILGVWDFRDRREVQNAINAARRQPKLVAGLNLGNEMVLAKRADWSQLANALKQLRQDLPNMPLTTTESFAEYIDQPQSALVLKEIDFMLVNIHPIFESWFQKGQPQNWADFVVNVTKLLSQKFPGPILVKETGIPTSPQASGYSETAQQNFYRALEKTFPPSKQQSFSYFSAFDAPWRLQDDIVGGGHHPEEAHWGLFRADRAPKAVIRDLPKRPAQKL